MSSSDLQTATRRAREAATEGNLDALAAALAEREAAIRETLRAIESMSDHHVSETILDGQAAAFRDGEAIRSMLIALRRRIDAQHRQLMRLSSTLANSGPQPQASIDFFG